MIEKMNFLGNSFVGIFSFTNDEVTLVRNDVKNVKKIKETLGTEVLKTTIGKSDLIGIFVCGNSNGFLVPYFTEKEEIDVLKKKFNVEALPSKYTCLGNMVLVNDKGCVASEVLPRKILEDVLGVEVFNSTIAELDNVGSIACVTNKAGIVHPDVRDHELEILRDVLKVDFVKATANSGVKYLRACMIANTKGAIVGDLSTGVEVVRIEDSLEV